MFFCYNFIIILTIKKPSFNLKKAYNKGQGIPIFCFTYYWHSRTLDWTNAAEYLWTFYSIKALSCGSSCYCSWCVSNTCGDSIRPLPITETSQHWCPSQFQTIITCECNGFSDLVVEFNSWHPSTDSSTRIGASLHTCNKEIYTLLVYLFYGSVSATEMRCGRLIANYKAGQIWEEVAEAYFMALSCQYSNRESPTCKPDIPPLC